MEKIDAEKMYEYSELLKVIRQTVPTKNIARVCLKNPTLREMAGYSNSKENFNPYIKKFMDKLVYDEHNKKVDIAKKMHNNRELKKLSNEVMQMAGYINNDGKSSVNEYAKSFVDRKMLDRQLSKLYKAVRSGDSESVRETYAKIYQMSEYGKDRPYGVINEYAQSFVDSRKEKFEKLGLHITTKNEQVLAI